MTYELIWIAAIVVGQEPMSWNIPDTTKFKNPTECVEFAKVMAPRLRDWVRGRFQADWDHEVVVRFRCAKSGEPV